MCAAPLGGPRRWRLPDVRTVGSVCLDYAPQLMARLTLAGQAMGDLSGFHNAMFIFHWDFSFKAVLSVTPELCPLRLSCNLSTLLLVLWGFAILQQKGLLLWMPPICPCQLSAQSYPLRNSLFYWGRVSVWVCVSLCVCEISKGFLAFKASLEISLNYFKEDQILTEAIFQK